VKRRIADTLGATRASPVIVIGSTPQPVRLPRAYSTGLRVCRNVWRV